VRSNRANEQRKEKDKDVVDISIEEVLRIRVSEIEEYEPDEDDDDEDDERFYRTITIETASGVIELDINAASEEALEFIEDN
jgi:hypothetical protein